MCGAKIALKFYRNIKLRYITVTTVFLFFFPYVVLCEYSNDKPKIALVGSGLDYSRARCPGVVTWCPGRQSTWSATFVT